MRSNGNVVEFRYALARETRKAMVYVSHDLGAIAHVCDRVLVMYADEVVLEGPARNVLLAPVHPYAQGLLASIPKLTNARLPDSLEGRPPRPEGRDAPSKTHVPSPAPNAERAGRHSRHAKPESL